MHFIGTFVLTDNKRENTDFSTPPCFAFPDFLPSKTCIPTPNNPGPVWTTNAGGNLAKVDLKF